MRCAEFAGKGPQRRSRRLRRLFPYRKSRPDLSFARLLLRFPTSHSRSQCCWLATTCGRFTAVTGIIPVRSGVRIVGDNGSSPLRLHTENRFGIWHHFGIKTRFGGAGLGANAGVSATESLAVRICPSFSNPIAHPKPSLLTYSQSPFGCRTMRQNQIGRVGAESRDSQEGALHENFPFGRAHRVPASGRDSLEALGWRPAAVPSPTGNYLDVSEETAGAGCAGT